MIRKILLGLLLCCSAASYADNYKQLTVASPNGKQVISFWQNAKADGQSNFCIMSIMMARLC